jgi:serine/threonine protein kinase
MIAPNTVIGNRYRVSRMLGGGGMKMVYLAEDLRLANRRCALAEMVDAITSPDMQQQAIAGFQREADMLAELNHEHIPRIFDRFSEQNRHYLVMEYVEGNTLEEELRNAGGKLPEERVIDIALQVLETLEYLHHREPPVIYRDLKPSNIMVSPSGQVKLIDFGIARHFQPLSSATMVGTQGYAPPEQYRGKVETRSDLYALGATMHHALSGRDPTTEPPFSFPLLRKLCPDLNPALADLVSEALIYDVERRIRDVDEVKHRLFAIRDGVATGAIGGQTTGPSTAGRSQLQLPLKTPPVAQPPQPPAAPSAPTLLTVTDDIPCPACTRSIPGDSRFCSYCAADLRQHFGPPQQVTDSEAQTITLTEPAQSHYQTGSAPHPGRQRRRHGRRSPLVTLLIVAGLVFLVLKLIVFLSSFASTIGSGDTAPAAPYARSGDPGVEGGGPSDEGAAVDPLRAEMLRQMLDAQGYGNVQFRLSGASLSLWGKVRSEADRTMVDDEASMLTGALTLEDHLQVGD